MKNRLKYITRFINLVMSKRTLSEARKKRVAERQFYKCANKPGSNLKGLGGVDCPLWLKVDPEIRGNFDRHGYEIDHKTEFCLTEDDSDENLHALCKMCHHVKTKDFNMDRSRKKKKIIEVDDDEVREIDDTAIRVKSLLFHLDQENLELKRKFVQMLRIYEEENEKLQKEKVDAIKLLKQCTNKINKQSKKIKKLEKKINGKDNDDKIEKYVNVAEKNEISIFKKASNMYLSGECKTLTEACKKAGITRRTYNRINRQLVNGGNNDMSESYDSDEPDDDFSSE